MDGGHPVHLDLLEYGSRLEDRTHGRLNIIVPIQRRIDEFQQEGIAELVPPSHGGDLFPSHAGVGVRRAPALGGIGLGFLIIGAPNGTTPQKQRQGCQTDTNAQMSPVQFRISGQGGLDPSDFSGSPGTGLYGQASAPGCKDPTLTDRLRYTLRCTGPNAKFQRFKS